MPKIIPPSPEAQNFMRYGEIPVDYSTGVPNINIPVYDLKSRKLSLPISISYHASGIKVSDKSSVIGLGWVLNAGGLITRSIMGFADGSASKPSITNASAWETARTNANIGYSAYSNFGFNLGLEEGNRDWLSDRYYYQLPGGTSGAFYYDFVTNNLIKVPYAPTKIELTGNNYRITDLNGIIYDFEPDTYYGLAPYPTAWSLKTIMSPDKTDTIRFVYKQNVTNYYLNGSYNSTLYYGNYPQQELGTVVYYQSAGVSSQPSNNSTSEVKILDSIISASTVIKVSIAQDRQDLYQSPANGKCRITKLSIYERYSGVLIKEIEFTQSYFGTSQENNLRMRLDGMTVKGKNSVGVENYSFDYEPGYLPPYPENYQEFHEDYWGYYNGTSSNSMIPAEFVPTSFQFSGNQPYYIPASYSTNRNPNHSYAKAALIKEIHYPTGGSTVFEFEPNYASAAYDVGNGLQSGNVGGFRIKAIKNYPQTSGSPVIKTYEYSPGWVRTIEEGLFSYGQSEFYHYGCPPQMSGIWKGEATKVHVLSSSLLPLSLDNGPPVFYETITEYMGDANNNSGKIVYQYRPPDQNNIYHDMLRQYPTYEFDKGNYTPMLISKTTYKNEGGAYLPVQKLENSYSPYLSSGYNTGIHLVHTRSYPQSGNNYNEFDFQTVPGVPSCNPSFTTEDHPEYYFFIDTRATTENLLLTASKNTDYKPDGSIGLERTTNYIYGDLIHLLPTKTTTTNSKAQTLSTELYYPDDFAISEPYSTMINRNILSPVVEQKIYNGTTFLQSGKTNYNFWTPGAAGLNLIEPITIESKIGAANIETRIRFHGYDNYGNVLSVSKESDNPVSYIWDYHFSYPVAQVTNAASSSAYTSFESDGKGNWTFAGFPFTDGSAPTGSKVYQVTASTPISKSGLSSTTYYLVSYWTKNSYPFTISGTQSGYPVNNFVINGWYYYEHKIYGQSSVVISGTGTIDEVRLYPFGAQMMTMTYNPLVGMTSQCDINSRVTKYEYDEFNRLILIRDQDKNLIKKICYNYNGQTENCNIYYNTAQSGNYTRACTGGETGSTVTYTVPANTYSSTISPTDANNKAIADVQANGQAYANAIGTCTAPLITIQGYNTKTSTYQVKFTNNATGLWYTFYLNPNTYSAYTLGQVPAGTYTVQFYPAGSPVYATYNINSYTQYGQYGATFYNISIIATSTASMY